MRRSGIEWTDYSWNPIEVLPDEVERDVLARGIASAQERGLPPPKHYPRFACTKVSPGCLNCYAGAMQRRIGFADYNYRDSKFDFAMTRRIGDPATIKKSSSFFVCSMMDLFHPSVSYELRAQVFDAMVDSPRHTFFVLTKRPRAMRDFVALYHERRPDRFGKPYHIWLGVSAEDHTTAKSRVPELLSIVPGYHFFLSLEPLLGPIDLVDVCTYPIAWKDRTRSTVEWVIVGGESGSAARPMAADWVRSIRDSCLERGIPFFFKQWGRWLPIETSFATYSFPMKSRAPEADIENATPGIGFKKITRIVRKFTYSWNGETKTFRAVSLSKKYSGNKLDGRTWDDHPLRMPRFLRDEMARSLAKTIENAVKGAKLVSGDYLPTEMSPKLVEAAREAARENPPKKGDG